MIDVVPCGDRKMRLYMVAGCRRIADLFPDGACAEVVDFVERLADQRRLEDRVPEVRKRIEALARANANKHRKRPWRGPARPSLARGIYKDRAFDRMPILADSLQDAGCDNEVVLSHCRDPKQLHVRGCWVVDLVLGKK